MGRWEMVQAAVNVVEHSKNLTVKTQKFKEVKVDSSFWWGKAKLDLQGYLWSRNWLLTLVSNFLLRFTYWLAAGKWVQPIYYHRTFFYHMLLKHDLYIQGRQLGWPLQLFGPTCSSTPTWVAVWTTILILPALLQLGCPILMFCYTMPSRSLSTMCQWF